MRKYILFLLIIIAFAFYGLFITNSNKKISLEADLAVERLKKTPWIFVPEDEIKKYLFREKLPYFTEKITGSCLFREKSLVKENICIEFSSKDAFSYDTCLALKGTWSESPCERSKYPIACNTFHQFIDKDGVKSDIIFENIYSFEKSKKSCDNIQKYHGSY